MGSRMTGADRENARLRAKLVQANEEIARLKDELRLLKYERAGVAR
jgi:hypothetical protein